VLLWREVDRRGSGPPTGIEETELGIKDVILPGEIRELVNKVVEVEREADPPLGAGGGVRGASLG
jgi:hypothetical protein